MPFKPERYPEGWFTFSADIRFLRAGGRCECTGECGLHSSPHLDKRCPEKHRYKAIFAKGSVFLSVAHLCDCEPLCKIPAHVKAMCKRCHLRVDRFMHAAARLANQKRNRERPVG